MLSSIHDDESPLNIWLERASLIAAPMLVCLIIFFQWFTGDLSSRTLDKPLDTQVASERALDPTIAGITINAKIAVRVHHYQAEHSDEYDFEVTAGEIFDDADKLAISRTDRFRAAIVIGELQGPQRAVERLTGLRNEVEPGGALSNEIGWVLPRYEAAVARKPVPDLPPEVVTAMKGRHGWFADLANAFGRDDSHPDRWYTIAGAERFFAFSDAQGVYQLATLLIGVVVAIAVAVAISRNGVENSDDPHVPTTIYLQAFCISEFLFALYLMVYVFLLGVDSPLSIVVTEALTWSSALGALYPLARGVKFRELLHDLGFIAPHGILKEVMMGAVGYLAGAPVVFIGVIVGSIVDDAIGVGEESAAGIPYFESPMSGSWILIVLGTISSCIWAPLVEETMYRGCLYRWCRVRLTWIPTTLLTAAVFAAVHPYTIGGMINIFACGLVWGLLREWRGSLYAPIVAHALHNTAIEFFSVGLLVALG